MCGIVGQAGGDAAPDAVAAVLRRQLALLHHRGPDDQGIVAEPGFALGHARLSIIDPALGHQPLATPDGDLTITFNGEIYNYVELRAELLRAGHRFSTQSDTEVLLAGYRQWGRDVLQKLDGMFAFAVYDRRDASLFCARDPYGQKPFYYHHDGVRFAFSSECSTFALLPGFDAVVDAASLADFLAFESLPFDRAIYRGVHKLPPGHCLVFRAGRVAVTRYFESSPHDNGTHESAEAIEHDVHALLRRAVERTFRADVPVGLLLSGGLDSSMVLALLREVHPTVPLRTFTIRNLDRSYNESAAAASLAAHFGTEHTEVEADPAALAAVARALPGQLDEPQADPGILPKSLVCGAVARTTKVALTGDGGDEFFYGYAVFRAERAARAARWVPGVLHRHLLQPLAQSLPASGRYMSLDLKLKAFTRGFPAPDHLRNFYWTSAFSDRELPALLTERGRDLGDVAQQLERMRDRWSAAQGRLGKLAYLYQQQYLPDYVLPNSDRASMLHSVELRTPFLSVDLVRRLNALPDDMKMRGGETKSLLRRIARRVLPAGIADAPKIGFTAPVASLLQNELREEVEDLLGASRLRQQGLFQPEYVAGLLQEHFSHRHNHYKPIWTLYVLQKWLLDKRISAG